MRDQTYDRDRQCAEPVPCSAPPCQRQSKKREPQRKIIIHETHVKDVAVSKDKQKWRQFPGRFAGGFGEKRKCSPEKNKYCKRDNDLFRRDKTKMISCVKEKHVEQNVIPLARDDQPGYLMTLDQLREPRIVNMAAQIASLNARMPKTRREQYCRYRDCGQNISANEV